MWGWIKLNWFFVLPMSSSSAAATTSVCRCCPVVLLAKVPRRSCPSPHRLTRSVCRIQDQVFHSLLSPTLRFDRFIVARRVATQDQNTDVRWIDASGESNGKSQDTGGQIRLLATDTNNINSLWTVYSRYGRQK